MEALGRGDEEPAGKGMGGRLRLRGGRGEPQEAPGPAAHSHPGWEARRGKDSGRAERR